MKRSSAWSIYLFALFLGLVGQTGVVVGLIALKDVPSPSYEALAGSLALLFASLVLALGTLCIVSTRRPWGIDPNVITEQRQPPSEIDPFALTTPELNIPYGRRKDDDKILAERLIKHIETISKPQPIERPAWAEEVLAGIPEESQE